MESVRSFASFLVLAVLAATGARSQPPPDSTVPSEFRAVDVALVGDMYPAGRKGPQPAPGKPVYYFPVVLGYTALGDVQKAPPPPPNPPIIQHLAHALAEDGYLTTHQVNTGKGLELSPPPQLLLVVNWGYLRPSATTQGFGQTVGLLAGQRFDETIDFGTNMNAQNILLKGGAQPDNRLFVIVTAYDFSVYGELAASGGKLKLSKLFRYRDWVAKMSLPEQGLDPAVAFDVLADHGTAVFGKETIGAKTLDVLLPEGQVQVGTPTVKP